MVDSINTRASLLNAVDSAKEASLDYYLFIRSAYGQVRENHINDSTPVDEFDDGFEFEDEDTTDYDSEADE